MNAVLDISNNALRDVIERTQDKLGHAREHGKFLAVSLDLEDADVLSTAAAAYLFTVNARESVARYRQIQENARRAKRCKDVRFAVLSGGALVAFVVVGAWLFWSNLVWR